MYLSSSFICLFGLLAVAHPLYFFLLKMALMEIIPHLLHVYTWINVCIYGKFLLPSKLWYEIQIKQTRSDPCERKPSDLIKMSEMPYLGQYLVVRKCFILKIATMNQICTSYKIYLLEIIGKLINKTKRATFPYPPFFWNALYEFQGPLNLLYFGQSMVYGTTLPNSWNICCTISWLQNVNKQLQQ